jgi:hypothetical protein
MSGAATGSSHSFPPPLDEDDDHFEDGPLGEYSDSELEALFGDFVRSKFGIDPKILSNAERGAMFAQFKAVFEQFKASSGGGQPQVSEPPRPAPPEPQSRLKELYRQLVRRLHPDTMTGNNAAVSAIWHDVQDAYRTGNVDRLETLLAMTDLQANTIGDQTSLAQMRMVLSDLRRSFNAIQRQIREAKKHPGWNFCSLGDRALLAKRVRADLDAKFQWLSDILHDLDEALAEWSAEPRSRRRSGKRK